MLLPPPRASAKRSYLVASVQILINIKVTFYYNSIYLLFLIHSFLLLVVRPGATSSALAPSSEDHEKGHEGHRLGNFIPLFEAPSPTSSALTPAAAPAKVRLGF